MDRDKIAVSIKTCHGRPSLFWALQSIEFGLSNIDYRIYIADEEPLDDWKPELYRNLRDDGHHVEVHEQNISCGAARNKLLTRLQDEKYVLRMDDDFELGGEFSIHAMIEAINVRDDVYFCSDYERQMGDNKGVRSGTLRPSGGTFSFKRKKLIKQFHSPFHSFNTRNGVRYTLAEHTRNLILLKRSTFDHVTWNEALAFEGEHVDFMLSMREAEMKGVYTPDSIHYHRDDLAHYREGFSGYDKSERRGLDQMETELMKRWGVGEVITQYPVTWYAVEFSRRLIAKALRGSKVL